jgi:hypothetical protein
VLHSIIAGMQIYITAHLHHSIPVVKMVFVQQKILVNALKATNKIQHVNTFLFINNFN